MTEGTYSLSDIAAATGRNGGVFGGNDSWFFILFLLLMGGGAYGYGANAYANGVVTRAEVQDGFNVNRIDNGISSLKDNVNSATYALNNSVRDGFAASTLAMTNGFNSVNSNIASLSSQMQTSCCDLKTTIHAEGEATRALIRENTIQELRDKIAEKDQELQSAQLTLANTVQTQNILGSLGTYYQNPSYSPNRCGCNCGNF